MNLHTNKLASAIKQISITMDNLLSLFRMHNDEKQKISIVTSLFRVKKKLKQLKQTRIPMVTYCL